MLISGIRTLITTSPRSLTTSNLRRHHEDWLQKNSTHDLAGGSRTKILAQRQQNSQRTAQFSTSSLPSISLYDKPRKSPTHRKSSNNPSPPENTRYRTSRPHNHPRADTYTTAYNAAYTAPRTFLSLYPDLQLETTWREGGRCMVLPSWLRRYAG